MKNINSEAYYIRFNFIRLRLKNGSCIKGYVVFVEHKETHEKSKGYGSSFPMAYLRAFEKIMHQTKV